LEFPLKQYTVNFVTLPP